MTKKDIDGIIVLIYGADYDRFLEATGVGVRYAYQGWSHGRFIAPMLQQAALIVASGMARNIAIVHGRRRRAFGQQSDNEMWRTGLGPHGEEPHSGPVGPVYGAAVAAQPYFEQIGRAEGGERVCQYV